MVGAPAILSGLLFMCGCKMAGIRLPVAQAHLGGRQPLNAPRGSFLKRGIALEGGPGTNTNARRAKNVPPGVSSITLFASVLIQFFTHSAESTPFQQQHKHIPFIQGGEREREEKR